MYIVVVGGGKVGEYLARILLDNGDDVAIIERDPSIATRLSETLTGQFLIINGDGCDSVIQEDAGIGEADVFVAVTGQDDNNLVACEIANRVFNIDRCIARVNSPKNIKIFERVGIETISSTVLIAGLIQEEALGGSMDATVALMQGNVIMTKINIKHFKTHDSDEGIVLGEITLPRNTKVVAVTDEDNEMRIATEKTRIFPGDDIVVASNVDLVDKTKRIFAAL